MEAFLYRTSPLDPLSYVVVLLPSWVAGLSAWLPARRAAAVDPVRVLGEPEELCATGRLRPV